MDLKNARLDHVAIAVSDLEQSIKVYEDLGIEFSPERERVESQKVIAAFAKIDDNAKLELLSPDGDEGPIKNYIDKKGQGIHHLCFEVDDVVKYSKELVQKGYKLIYDEPQEGAHNKMINFIHPKSTGGVLIEISSNR